MFGFFGNGLDVKYIQQLILQWFRITHMRLIGFSTIIESTERHSERNMAVDPEFSEKLFTSDTNWSFNKMMTIKNLSQKQIFPYMIKLMLS